MLKSFLLLSISLSLLADDKRQIHSTPVYMNTVFAQREEKFKSLKNTKTYADNIKRMYATDCIERKGSDFSKWQGALFIDGHNIPPRLYGMYFTKDRDGKPKKQDPNWLTSYLSYKGFDEYLQIYLQNMRDKDRPKAFRQGVHEGSEFFMKTNGNISIKYHIRGVGTSSVMYELIETKMEKSKEVIIKKTICETSQESIFKLK